MYGKCEKDYPRSLRSYCLKLHGKETPFSMWKVLTDLFQNNNDHTKMALIDKLRKIKMEKGNTIPKYLTKSPNVEMIFGVLVLQSLNII